MTVGSPDPVSGRWLRGFAIAAVVACGVVMCLHAPQPADPALATRLHPLADPPLADPPRAAMTPGHAP